MAEGSLRKNKSIAWIMDEGGEVLHTCMLTCSENREENNKNLFNRPIEYNAPQPFNKLNQFPSKQFGIMNTIEGLLQMHLTCLSHGQILPIKIWVWYIGCGRMTYNLHVHKGIMQIICSCSVVLPYNRQIFPSCHTIYDTHMNEIA